MERKLAWRPRSGLMSFNYSKSGVSTDSVFERQAPNYSKGGVSTDSVFERPVPEASGTTSNGGSGGRYAE